MKKQRKKRGGQVKHGMCGTRIYSAWNRMVQRCHNPASNDFARYGAKGITVCDRWRFGSETKTGFENFLADVGSRPDGLELDRIDNDAGYSPTNVRWATRTQNQNNKSTNHIVVYRRKRMSIADAVRAAGSKVTRETARCRINNGWTTQKAVETPPLFRREAGTRRVIANQE